MLQLLLHKNYFGLIKTLSCGSHLFEVDTFRGIENENLTKGYDTVFCQPLDGREDSLKQLNYFRDISCGQPVIALITKTEGPTQPLEIEALKSGADEVIYLPKNVEPSQFDELLLHAINKVNIRKIQAETHYNQHQNSLDSIRKEAPEKNIFEITPELQGLGKWEYAIKTESVYWSSALFKIYGRDESDGSPTLDEMCRLYHPWDEGHLRSVIDSTADTGKPHNYYLKLIEGKDVKKYLTGVAEVLKDDQGQVSRIRGVSRDVTAQKFALRQMDQTKELLRSISGNINAVIIRFRLNSDNKLSLIFANNKLKDVFEVSEAMVMNDVSTISNQIIPDDAREILSHFHKAIQTKESFESNCEIKTPSGKQKFIRVTIQPYIIVKDYSEWDAVIVDVSKEIEIKRKLQENEFRFRGLVENAFDTFSITSPEGVVNYVSPTVYRLIGFLPEEVIGKNVLEFVHPEDIDEVQGQIKKLLSGSINTFTVKQRIRHKKGHYVWIEDSITDHRHTKGIEGVVSNFRDIEREHKYEEELELSKLRFEYVSKATQDVIWDFDLVNKTLSFGGNFEKLYGISVDACTSLSDYANLMAPEDRNEVLEDFDNFLEGDGNYWKAFYSIVKKDGTLSPVIDQAYVLRDDEGKAYRVIGTVHDISSELDYRKQVQQSEMRFSRLFNNAPIGIVMLSAENQRFIRANDAFLQMLGYSISELRDKTSKDLISDLDPNQKSADLTDKLKKTESYGPEKIVFRKKNGKNLFALISGYLQRNPNGKDPVVWAYIMDISEVIAKNEELKSVETKFQRFLKNASDLFIIIDEDQKFTFCSVNLKDVLGYSTEEVLGKSIIEFTHPEDYSFAIEKFLEAQQNENTTYTLIYRVLHKNGHYLFVETNGLFTTNADGKKEAYLIVRDIDEHVRRNKELERLSLVADRTTNAVMITNQKDQLTWVNKGFENLTGYTLKEVEGRKPASFLRSEKTNKQNAARIDKLAKKLKPFKGEILNQKKNEELFWAEIFVTPILDKDQNFQGFINIQNDATKKVERNQELKKALALSRQQSKRLQNFTHIVSHNFRSHGANIYQLTEELKKEQDQSVRESLTHYLEKSARDLLTALDELNEILRIQENTDLEIKDLTLKSFVNRTRDILRIKIEESNATITCKFEDEFKVRFYPAYLESILYNLISNAIRYKHPSRSPQITISASLKNSHIRIDVKDNGLGIDLKLHKDKIFKMRKVFHNHPEAKGMGLFIVKSQLEALGGEISVKSEVNKGSTFIMKLPS